MEIDRPATPMVTAPTHLIRSTRSTAVIPLIHLSGRQQARRWRRQRCKSRPRFLCPSSRRSSAAPSPSSSSSATSPQAPICLRPGSAQAGPPRHPVHQGRRTRPAPPPRIHDGKSAVKKHHHLNIYTLGPSPAAHATEQPVSLALGPHLIMICLVLRHSSLEFSRMYHLFICPADMACLSDKSKGFNFGITSSSLQKLHLIDQSRPFL